MPCGCGVGTSPFFMWFRETGTVNPAPDPQLIFVDVNTITYDLTWLWIQPIFPNPPCTNPLPVTLYWRRLSGPDGPSADTIMGWGATQVCPGARDVKLIATGNPISTAALTVVQKPIYFCRPGIYEVWGERFTCSPNHNSQVPDAHIARRVIEVK